MKTWIRFSLFNALITSLAFGQSLFSIEPYFLLDDDKIGYVAFELKDDADAQVEIETENKFHLKELRSELEVKANQLIKIKLTKNMCEQELRYSVSVKDEVKTGNIHTYPCEEDEEFVFGFMSDTQMTKEKHFKRHRKIADLANELKYAYPMNFIINSGDIVHNGGVLEEWYRYFDFATPYLNHSYIIPVVGNHEYYDDEAIGKAPKNFMHFLRPKDSHELGITKLKFPQFDLIVFNSNFKQIYDEAYQYQMDWLKAQLNESYAENKNVFITMHHSPYSSSFEYRRKIPKKLRKEFVPLIEQYPNVRMVLSGHLHMYERSLRKGKHYIIAGPSAGRNNYWTYPNRYSEIRVAKTGTFSVFRVTKSKAALITYNEDKDIIEEVEFNFD